MKKYLLFTFLIFLFPLFVNAQEYCKVVSGNGKDIGSEIACGTEHFYIVDSNNNKIRMLAKYNLYTGVSIYKEELPTGKTCEEIASERGGTVKSDDFYNQEGYCFYTLYTDAVEETWDIGSTQNALSLCMDHINALEDDDYHYEYSRVDYSNSSNYICHYLKSSKHIKQNETAISAHWDADGNYLYPQVGDIYVYSTGSLYGGSPTPTTTDFLFGEKNGENYPDELATSTYKYRFFDYPVNLGETINTSDLGRALKFYKQELSQNYNVEDISLMTLDDINVISKKTSSREFPYSDWYSSIESEITNTGVKNHYEFANISSYFNTKNSWLYDTTYWVRTGYNKMPNYNPYYIPDGLIFVNTFGGVCGGTVNGTVNTTTGCNFYANTKIGTGVRPLITIPDELQYMVKTEPNGNGEIEAVEYALGNEEITFKIKSNDSTKLKSIIVRTDSGEEVEFYGDELTLTDEGTYKISTNRFIMPHENVTIITNWDIENPLTKNPIKLFLLTVGISILWMIIDITKKKRLNPAV